MYIHFSNIEKQLTTDKLVFESKNYSGWVFGSENQKNWYQTLPMGKGRQSSKETFLNPIMQNRLHIKSLKTFLGKDVPGAVATIENKVPDCLTQSDINELYEKLYPCSQVDVSVKENHIANIKKTVNVKAVDASCHSLIENSFMVAPIFRNVDTFENWKDRSDFYLL